MDDDLSQFDSLTDDLVGSRPESGSGNSNTPSAAPNAQSTGRSWPKRLHRGLFILLTGRYNGIQFYWRDRLAVLMRVVIAMMVVAATASIVFDLTGTNTGPLWELQVLSRNLILQGFEIAGATGLFLLNTPWVALVVAALLGSFVYREVW